MTKLGLGGQGPQSTCLYLLNMIIDIESLYIYIYIQTHTHTQWRLIAFLKLGGDVLKQRLTGCLFKIAKNFAFKTSNSPDYSYRQVCPWVDLSQVCAQLRPHLLTLSGKRREPPTTTNNHELSQFWFEWTTVEFKQNQRRSRCEVGRQILKDLVKISMKSHWILTDLKLREREDVS